MYDDPCGLLYNYIYAGAACETRRSRLLLITMALLYTLTYPTARRVYNTSFRHTSSFVWFSSSLSSSSSSRVFFRKPRRRFNFVSSPLHLFIAYTTKRDCGGGIRARAPARQIYRGMRRQCGRRRTEERSVLGVRIFFLLFLF